MRNLSITLIYILLVIAALIWGLVIMFLVQRAWLKNVQLKLTSTPFVGLPTSTTPISNFSIPTAPNSVSVGKEAIINKLGITVKSVVRPADKIVANADKTNLPPEPGKDYLMVYIKVRCVSKSESCRVTEFDFGVHSKAGHDYPAELSGNFTNIKGLFEGGDIKSGQSLAGPIFFMIDKVDRDLTLVYPRMFGFGTSVEFVLGQ
jgi:uncharacterized protein DUF4352